MTVVPARVYTDHVMIATANKRGRVYLWTGVDKGMCETFNVFTQLYAHARRRAQASTVQV
jgi:hypothetical protein